MKTDDFTRLIPPQPAQVNIDPTPKDCPSEGFNYPTFRLLNKQERVKLSAKRFEPDPSTFYNHLAVANSRGWFAAVTVLDDGSYALICSPLVDLRVAYKNAKDSESVYTPKRKVPLQSQKPNIIALASNDTRLFMSLESGDLLVYDTAILFSAGSDAVSPMHVLPPDTGPIRYIVPNPGTESNLVDLVAVVRSNMTVVLYNSTLEVQGGWIAPDGDLASAPVAAAWSPKGKHIAIGLQSGHILTYPLTNKSSINKHIPPTSQPPLVALEWLSPGHTFRTSYAPSSGTTDPKQHIICVDVKSSTATYYAPSYPFPLPDRNNQPFAVVLPKWDEDPGANEPRSLVVVGDKASVDVEVLGNTGTQWYQQSQENPLSLPLDSNLEDTMLFDLEVDLTDVDTWTPILYAYLNDGTMQGWYMEHTKLYPGMVHPQPVPAPTPTAAPVAFGQPAPAPSTTVTPPAQQTTFGQAAFGQTTTPSAFGQPSFGQPTAFGQPQKTPTFGTPGFGQAAPAGGKVLFGKTSSPSAFSGGAAASPFGQPASTSTFGTPSGAHGGGAFGAAAPTSTFGSTAFGSTTSTTNAFGSGAFGGFANANGDKNAFGQASFGFGSSTPSPAAAPAPAPAEMTREASMSDDTPSLGGISLGESGDTSKETKSGGIFGSFPSATSSTTTTSTFGGGAIKPATGFGAFGNTPTFGQSAFSKPAAPAFGSTTTPAATGGFAAFASSTPSAFGSATTTQASATASTPATGGAFGAFAAGSPSPFGATASQSTTTTSPFTAASTQPKSPFAPSGGAAPAFGAPAFGVSPFGAQPGARARSPSGREKDESPPATAKMPSKPTAFAPSPMSSPESTPRLGKATIVGDEESPPPPPAFKTTTTPATSPFGTVTAPASGAFGNIQTSPSVFKPATGFGAFGSDKAPASSPFFKAPTEPKTPPVTVFASALTSPPGITPQAATTASPMFGAASSLGAARPVFTPAAPPPTPVKAPATGGFGAFSGTSTGFAAFGGPKKSFGELLKTADVDTTDPVKPKTGAVLEAPKDVEKKKPVSAFPSITKPSSVFTPPEEVVEKKKEEPEKKKEEAEKKEEPSALPAREKAKEKEDVVTEELSFGNLSLLSNASSFAEVEVEEPEEEEVRSTSEDEEGEAQLEYEEEEPFLSEEGEEELLSSEESSQLSDVPEEEEEEEAEEERKAEAESREPTAVPLPVSRSPSATPQPEAPKITVTPSPPPDVALSTVVEESTTPPGTPTKEPVAPVPRAPSAPLPATAHTPPFGLGLGRPSTRPTRSSPLAGAPVSLAAEEEPSPVKPPVSPKPRVAPLPQEVVPLKGEDEEEKAAGAKPARPKTPPLLSAFGPKKTEAPSPVLAPTAPPPTTPATPASNLFGQFKPPTPGTPTETPPGKTTPPPSGFSLFGAAAQPPAFDFSGLGATPKPFAPTSPPQAAAPAQPSPATAGTLLFGPSQVPTTVGGAFGMQGKETQATTEAAKAPSFDLSGFSLKGKAAPAPAGAAAPATPPPFDLSGFSLKGKAAGAPAPQPPALQVPTEAGMQRECVLLVNHVNEDLASLARLAEQHKKHLEQLRARVGGRQRQDLFDAKKWSPATAAQFGAVMVQFEKDLDELKDVRDGQREILREIQASMLKAGTRKEEISRFNKAKSDKEFAKMLKSRTLGPEHLETQTQLRRNIRTMRDRIQKLEDHLKASKKKLTQVKTGQPGLRAPSLDTINRTYRNIDLAIQHQSAEVAQLKKRMARLQLSARSSPASASPTPSPSRDPRLPDPIARPYNVTPHVAVTTAAALNAERSASKLKRALLATRKEPLLNTRARAAAPPPLSFGTPQKQEQPSPSPFNFSTPTPKHALEDTATPKPGVPSTPDWGIILPADNHHHHHHHYSPSPSPSPTLARRGAGAGVKRHSVVPLRKGGTGSPGGAEVGKGFDWGPLPTFNRGTPGSFTMVEAVRLTPPKQGQGQGQGQEGK
ncbi:putative nuclear pore complex [Lyophyllum shimeji]|uniref:Nuclear pore complex n=1 Tax=Lyophyllum shimeji TaxID=47721 RepID=A0A9P3PSB5_LYOSH|nr:putative nuclear pore complex [Lyophyllum shimeji]